MKTSTIDLIKKFIVGRAFPTLLIATCTLTGFSQSLTSEFITAGYTLTDLGSVDALPTRYGGLTIRPEQPNILYIGGNANAGNGALYTVELIRDPEENRITGFAGAAELYDETPNIDGGVSFAPNGTLLFTRYNQNHLGQILPNNDYISTPLSELGVASSVGSLAIVPYGFPGEGNLVLSSYNSHMLYNMPYTIDGSGQYVLSAQNAEVSVSGTASGPEGIAYIPIGSAAFPNLSMVVSSYSRGRVMVFDVDNQGLPDVTTARDMVTGLTGAEGALIDPVTGDFLFSTFGGGNKIIRISGFEVPFAVTDQTAPGQNLFEAFPNPASDQVTLKFLKADISGTIEIFNTPGKRLIKENLSGEKVYHLDISSLPKGSYIIRVKNGKEIVSQRLFKL